MFTKFTATLILTIFCFTQVGFAAPALNRSEATGLGPAQNLREQTVVERGEESAGATGRIVGALVQAGRKLVQPFMKKGIRRILLVEDEEDTLNLMEQGVKAWDTKVYVAKATTKDIALRIFKEQGPFDAVITDYSLGMDGGYGDEVIEAINPQTREKTIPIILLSNGQRYQLEPVFMPLKKSGQLIDFRSGKDDIVKDQAAFNGLLDELKAAAGQPAAAAGEAGATGEVVAEINTMASELINQLPPEKAVTVEQGSAVVITNLLAFRNRFGLLAFLPSLAKGMLKDAVRFAVIVPGDKKASAAQKKMIEYFNATMPEGKSIEIFNSEVAASRAMAGLDVKIYGTLGENIDIRKIKVDLGSLLYDLQKADFNRFDTVQQRFKKLQTLVATEV